MDAHSISLVLFTLVQDKLPSAELTAEVNNKLKEMGLSEDIKVEFHAPEPDSSSLGGWHWFCYSDLGIKIMDELNNRWKEDGS